MLNDMTRNYYGQRGMNRNMTPPVPVPQPGLPALPSDATVAIAYVPMQTDTTVYDAEKALQAGTLFPVLNCISTRIRRISKRSPLTRGQRRNTMCCSASSRSSTAR